MQGQTFSRIICNFMTRIVAIPDFAKMWNVIFEHAHFGNEIQITLLTIYDMPISWKSPVLVILGLIKH